MRRLIMLFWVLSLSLIFSGCDINTIDESVLENIDIVQAEFDITTSSETVITILQDNQLWNLVEWIHPEKWIRFSPYTYIDVEEHNILFSGDIINNTDQNYVWGYTDWKWDAIELSISDYISMYAGNADYIWSATEVLIDYETMRWNNLNNINEIYPDSKYIEYYISGFDPQYDGMDWKSITIVFEEFEWEYYVVWIINWSWTI